MRRRAVFVMVTNASVFDGSIRVVVWAMESAFRWGARRSMRPPVRDGAIGHVNSRSDASACRSRLGFSWYCAGPGPRARHVHHRVLRLEERREQIGVLSPVHLAIEPKLTLELAVDVDHALAIHHLKGSDQRLVNQRQLDAKLHAGRGAVPGRLHHLPGLEIGLPVHRHSRVPFLGRRGAEPVHAHEMSHHRALQLAVLRHARNQLGVAERADPFRRRPAATAGRWSLPASRWPVPACRSTAAGHAGRTPSLPSERIGPARPERKER